MKIYFKPGVAKQPEHHSRKEYETDSHFMKRHRTKFPILGHQQLGNFLLSNLIK